MSEQTETDGNTPRSEQDVAVLYNAECAVCRFEIDHYASYAEAKALAIRFDDLNTAGLEKWGLTQNEAAKRLYVQKGDTLLSGIPAFLILWEEMPRYRWLSKLVGLPGVFQIACFVYDRVLAPILYHRQKHRYAGAEKSGKTTSVH